VASLFIASKVSRYLSILCLWVYPITAKLLRCDWLRSIGLLLTRAVRHLAAQPFSSDRWLHRPRWVGWLLRYLDIYLFYVYVRHGSATKESGNQNAMHNGLVQSSSLQNANKGVTQRRCGLLPQLPWPLI